MGEYNTGKWALLRKTCAISGIIQGFTWFAMALVCIVLFFEKPSYIKDFSNTTINKNTPFVNLILFCIYDSVLDKDSTENDRMLIPKNVNIIVWIYAFLGLGWLGLSIYEFTAIFRKKSHGYSTHNLTILAVVTLLISTLDAVVFSLASYTYFKINPFDYTQAEECKGCDFQAQIDQQFKKAIGRKIGFGVVMTLASRGFVLWVLNCVTGVVLLSLAVKIYRLPPILQYDESIPRAILDKSLLSEDSGRSSLEFTKEARNLENEKLNFRPPHPAKALEANNFAPRVVCPKYDTSTPM